MGVGIYVTCRWENVQQLYKIQMPYLTFVDETKVAGNNGCNNIAGSYTLDGKVFHFTQMISNPLNVLSRCERKCFYRYT